MASGRKNEDKTYPVGNVLFHRVKGTDDWMARDKPAKEGELGIELAKFLKGAPARKFCEDVNKRRADGKSIDDLIADATRVYETGSKQREQKELQKQNALKKAATTTPAKDINPVAEAAASLEETTSNETPEEIVAEGETTDETISEESISDNIA